jgi:hypothetical protein
MSAFLFLPCFALFGFSVAFLWLVGAAAFFREDWPESPYCAPWLGYGILVGVLQVVHLFSPITLAISIVVLAAASVLACVVLIARWLKKRPNRTSIRRWATLLALLPVIALLAFVPVFNCCTKEVFSYDLGLYYLQTIRWTETFSIVRGLVNLQPQLAFNQSAFLVAALFDSLLPNRWGVFLIGGVLPWLGFSLSVFAIVQIALSQFSRGTGVPPIEVAYAISLPAWIFILLGGSISSASPDSVSFCLMLHFFLIFSCFVVSRMSEERRERLGEILFIGALCLCVNLNSLALVGGALTVCGASLFVQKERARFLQQGRLVIVAILSIIILTTWMGRGVLLSGYPFFPSSAIAMPVPWRMPVKQVDSFRGAIIAGARDPYSTGNIKKTLRTWRWVPGWIEHAHSSINQFIWPVQVGLAGCIVLAAGAAMERSLREHLKDFFILAVPLLLQSIFWFLTVPEPRDFAFAAWLFTTCPALTFIAGGMRITFASTVANLCLNALPILFLAWDFRWSWSRSEPQLPQLTIVDTVAVTNMHGVQTWIPVSGNQPFDSPLPSAQRPTSELALLDPQKGISGGFKFLKPASPQ